jgi:hypothetical protein
MQNHEDREDRDTPRGLCGVISRSGSDPNKLWLINNLDGKQCSYIEYPIVENRILREKFGKNGFCLLTASGGD